MLEGWKECIMGMMHYLSLLCYSLVLGPWSAPMRLFLLRKENNVAVWAVIGCACFPCFEAESLIEIPFGDGDGHRE